MHFCPNETDSPPRSQPWARYEQVPYDLLQPVPQCPVVEPHHPYCEQQLPNVEPWQVRPAVPAHVPSVETLEVEVGVAAFVVVVLVGAAELPEQVPKVD